MTDDAGVAGDGVDPARFDVDVPRDGYAWWYVDALSDDGRHALTIIAFLGSVFSPYYAHATHRLRRRGDRCGADPLQHCALNVALYGRPGARWSMTERPAGAVRRTADRLAIGPSAIEATADGWRLSLDEVAVPIVRRIRGTIDVRFGARPAHRDVLDAAGRHAWTVIAPRARIDVRCSVPDLAWSGTAYVDANRGAAPLEDDFVAWNWSRLHRADGGTSIAYDVRRTDGSAYSAARSFDAAGATMPFEPPPHAPLPPTRWRLAPSTRCDPGATPGVVRTLEDGPFYARSVIETTWHGTSATGVHEHLSLDRFRRRAVRLLLPFRMPRTIA